MRAPRTRVGTLRVKINGALWKSRALRETRRSLERAERSVERIYSVTITDEHHGKVAILRLKGAFVGKSNVSIFERAIFDQLKNDVIWIVLDLGDVKYIDSSGLGAMISAMVSVGRRGGGLKLAAVVGDVQRTMTIMHLDQVFEMHKTVQRAEASIGN